MLHNPALKNPTLDLIVVQIERVYFYTSKCISSKIMNLIFCIQHCQRAIIVKIHVHVQKSSSNNKMM